MQTASWRYIFSLLCFLGVFATGAILWMLFWMTARIDLIEHQKTHALIELKLAETVGRLQYSVEDYAYWTLAYDLVNAGDSDAIFDNIGSGATDSELFDQLFILDANGTVLHAFDEELGADAHALFDANTFNPVWKALREIDARDQQSIQSLVEIEGKFAFMVAAWITPSSIDDFPDGPFPVLVGVIHLDQARIEMLVKDTQIMTAKMRPPTDESLDNNQDGSLPLFDLNDRSLGALDWTLDYSGTKLRNELLPGVLLMGFGILGICGAAARYFHSQHGTLVRANKVATTDQLTSLLNRAGLVEALRGREIIRSLDKGHFAAIYLDLNKFKDLNDTFGHSAGDIALRITAERMQSAVRKSDIVARIGGDEFVCAILDPNPETAAMIVAKRILDLAKVEISIDGHNLLITPSVGVAVATPGTHWETVLSQSDAAMYWSKQEEANYPVVFCKTMVTGNQGA